MSGFRVWGLGSRVKVKGVELRVQAVWFRVRGLESRVKVEGVGFRVHG